MRTERRAVRPGRPDGRICVLPLAASRRRPFPGRHPLPDSLPRRARECQPRLPGTGFRRAVRAAGFPGAGHCRMVRNSCQIQALRGMRGVLTCDHERL
jgi:hypothetical protein